MMDTPDDNKLSAWLDGELDAQEAAQVEAWLGERPQAAARVREWAADRDALRARFDPVLNERTPQRLSKAVLESGSRLARPWALAAATAGVFVLGGAVGALVAWQAARTDSAALAQQAPVPWVQRAAVAHSVYVPEVRHPVEVNVADRTAPDVRAQEEHLARWLTRRLDVPVKLFDLREHGYELVGGRLLPDAAGPSAQLMYQRAGGGERVTVYLRKPDSGPEADAPAAFHYTRRGELGLFYWVEGAAGYALVGALPRDKLLALAEVIHRQGSAVEVPALR
jgi:anti-sigma factor RsiW